VAVTFQVKHGKLSWKVDRTNRPDDEMNKLSDVPWKITWEDCTRKNIKKCFSDRRPLHRANTYVAIEKFNSLKNVVVHIDLRMD
jgi:hypothetical protein